MNPVEWLQTLMEPLTEERLLEGGGYGRPCLEQKAPPEADRPLWEVAEGLSSTVPVHCWMGVPSDGAKNLDHYLYGAQRNKP